MKLSDNYAKAMGAAAEIERYRRVFGTAGVADAPVLVWNRDSGRTSGLGA